MDSGGHIDLPSTLITSVPSQYINVMLHSLKKKTLPLNIIHNYDYVCHHNVFGKENLVGYKRNFLETGLTLLVQSSLSNKLLPSDLMDLCLTQGVKGGSPVNSYSVSFD